MQLGRVDGEIIGSGLTPQQGFSPVGAPSPGGWVSAPSTVFAVAAQVTVTTAATCDWSRYGVFQYLLTANNQLTFTFTNVSVGQTIVIGLKEPSSLSAGATSVVMPGTCVLTGTAGSFTTPTQTANVVDVLYVTCISPGVYVVSLN